jgi:hypothetical protein
MLKSKNHRLVASDCASELAAVDLYFLKQLHRMCHVKHMILRISLPFL